MTKYKYPSFDDIVWAVAIRDIIGYNKSYDELMKNKKFLKVLRKQPYELTEDEIIKNLLKFLNEWGCRITEKKFGSVSKKIVDFLRKNEELFNSLSREKIQSYDFSKNENQLVHLFKKLKGIPEIGPTSVSKILHVLNPDLFVMWDRSIAKTISKHSIEGYLTFLKEMQKGANKVEKTFHQNGDLEIYLNEKFKLSPKCTLSKFLDEYNWGKYRKKWKFPPNWDAKILVKKS